MTTLTRREKLKLPVKGVRYYWVDPSRKIPMDCEPIRVQTVIHNQDPAKIPDIEDPKHNMNVFIEDIWQDWRYENGILHYYSRVALDNVWIRCEFV